MEEIWIPNSVNKIVWNQFLNCKKLKKIHWKNQIWQASDFNNHATQWNEKTKEPIFIQEYNYYFFRIAWNIFFIIIYNEKTIENVKKMKQEESI